jgi:hypothetical protein
MHPFPRCTSFIAPRRPLASALAATLLFALASSVVVGQNAPADDAAKRRRGTTDDSGGRRGGSPDDAQARLASLRERFEVADDDEWKIISERIGKVVEIRRSGAGSTFGGSGTFGGRGPQPAGGGDNRGSRGTRPGGNPEMTALQSAIRDKLPDAEVKSRLDRVRELRKENESKLAKAQEELRAVLSVRQEAVAVVFGLLP